MEFTLLDGGTGDLLKRRGVASHGLAFQDQFASAQLANVAQPDVVQNVHQEYVEAGADVITCNNFSCTRHSMAKMGLDGEKALELAEAAARLAKEVAARSDRPVLVAGSLPPLTESYRSEGLHDFEVLQPEYKQLTAVLAPHVDLILCETLSTVAEALAAGTAASSTGLPWWLALTLQDNDKALLRSGQRLEEAVAALLPLPGLQAVLLNCCAPQAVTAALPALRDAVPVESGVQIGAYANGFQRTTSEWLGEGSSEPGGGFFTPPAEEYDERGIILPEAYAAHVRRWLQLGAGVVGGCCGVGPAHIAKLAEIKHRSAG